MQGSTSMRKFFDDEPKALRSTRFTRHDGDFSHLVEHSDFRGSSILQKLAEDDDEDDLPVETAAMHIRPSLADYVRDEMDEQDRALFFQRVYILTRNKPLSEIPEESGATDFFTIFSAKLRSIHTDCLHESFTTDNFCGLYLCMCLDPSKSTGGGTGGNVSTGHSLIVLEGPDNMVGDYCRHLGRIASKYFSANCVFDVEDRLGATLYFETFEYRRCAPLNSNEKFATATPNDENLMGRQHLLLREKIRGICVQLRHARTVAQREAVEKAIAEYNRLLEEAAAAEEAEYDLLANMSDQRSARATLMSHVSMASRVYNYARSTISSIGDPHKSSLASIKKHARTVGIKEQGGDKSPSSNRASKSGQRKSLGGGSGSRRSISTGSSTGSPSPSSGRQRRSTESEKRVSVGGLRPKQRSSIHKSLTRQSSPSRKLQLPRKKRSKFLTIKPNVAFSSQGASDESTPSSPLASPEVKRSYLPHASTEHIIEAPTDVRLVVPEIQRLELALSSTRFYRNIAQYARIYWHIPVERDEESLVWPVPFDYAPLHIFERSEFDVNLTFADYGKAPPVAEAASSRPSESASQLEGAADGAGGDE